MLLAAAVPVTEREASVPDEREVLLAVSPVPVVSESQFQVVVYAPMVRVWFPSGEARLFHLEEIPP